MVGTARAQLEAGSDFATDYVWRGFDVLSGGPAIMPWIDYGLGETGLGINVWSSWALTKRDKEEIRNLDELDFTLYYDRQVNQIGLSAGIIYYTFPQMEGALDEYSTDYEVYIGATLTESPVTPGLTIYYAFNDKAWDGLYALLSAGYTLETETAPLDFSLSLGYSNQSLVTDITDSGISDINLGVGTSISTKYLTYSPSITATFVPDDLIYQDQFILWGMLGISWSQ